MAAKTVLQTQHLTQHRSTYPKTRHGHEFAPDPTPPSFHTIIDPDKNPPQPWRDLPPATGLPPYRMELSAILDPKTVANITKDKKLVFHAVGDTGGVTTSTYIEGVSRFMEADYEHAPSLKDRPSFFYHLGDVVYYDGEGANYWEEFYDPYENYPAPIVAIPGNHDGDVNPSTGETSLQAFVRNFCSQSAVISPDNRDAPRRTMTQPNVYWTLLTPLVTIVGLYSNCPEGGQISDIQRQWFVKELKEADKKLPVIVTVHHPIYSAYGTHPGSTRLKTFMDECVAASGRVPDLVLSGHVHDYQRFSAPLGGKDVPFIVAGSGGYKQRLHRLGPAFQQAKASNSLPVQIAGDPSTLENFNDRDHGYLRVSVTKSTIVVDFVAVPDPAQQQPGSFLPAQDSVTINI